MTPFAAWARWWQSSALAALGAMAALGQAPLGWWWMTVATLALLLRLFPMTGAQPVSTALRWGWCFGFGYFAVALRWIVEPFLVDVARDGWMAPFAMLLMASGAALFWGLAAAFARWLRPGAVWPLAAALAGAEITRALVLTGFPWVLLGHIWVGTPLAQLAALAGPHGLTLFTLALALAGAALLDRNRVAAVAIPVVAALWVVSDPGPPDPAPSDSPLIRLVQPNAPQNEKWDPARNAIYFDRMLAYTGSDARPALVVWPETAIPALLDFAQPAFDLAAEAARGAPLIMGLNRSDGPLYHNSLVVLGPTGQPTALYDKRHLVPFGEYIPFGNWLARYGIHGLAASEGMGFTPGTRDGVVDLPGIGPARALICYEGIFAEEIAAGARPRLLVLITNDAWFGTGPGPTQHLAQARLRAIEQGLPMVRVANTGISAMIDARGRLTATLPLGEAGYLDAPLPAALSPTPYTRWGDLPAILLVVAALGLARATRGRPLSD